MSQASTKIRIENLIHIYGDKPRSGLKLFREGNTRESILQATGQVLGIADVSFTINAGELFVVMGLSGSGKSTLVRCLNRLIHPISGHIFLDDEDIVHVDEKRMRQIRLMKVSMVFQRFGLFPHQTVVENVEYGLKLRGIEKAKRHKKAMETLELVNLEQWANYLPTSLSGGMQQRVGLARALATDAEILLMDEAFSALDPLIRRDMQDELLRLQKDLHKTIVFISHDIQEALKLGDRILVMRDGALVQIGTPENLVEHPSDDYIRAFMQDVNRAQFLTAGSLARQAATLPLGQTSATATLAQMTRDNLQQLYLLDEANKPVGLVQKTSLETSLQSGNEDMAQIMQTDFPVVNASTRLEHTFNLYQSGLPLVAIDAEGTFQGVVDPVDVLSRMIPSPSS